jgi:hypothetical protein
MYVSRYLQNRGLGCWCGAGGEADEATAMVASMIALVWRALGVTQACGLALMKSVLFLSLSS